MEVTVEPSWRAALANELEAPYFSDLMNFVGKEYETREVYPAREHVFRAFNECPLSKTRVVILGQDPYHGENQATGLAFSTHQNSALPPSLVNIYKELAAEYQMPLQELRQRGGDLSSWAHQGVLLLNGTLTVRADLAGSHQGKGWEQFTDAVVHTLSQNQEHLVFMLWGNYAKAKGALIDRTKHLVLESPHPSPLSAHRGFFGNGHFKQANEYLVLSGRHPIDWI